MIHSNWTFCQLLIPMHFPYYLIMSINTNPPNKFTRLFKVLFFMQQNHSDQKQTTSKIIVVHACALYFLKPYTIFFSLFCDLNLLWFLCNVTGGVGGVVSMIILYFEDQFSLFRVTFKNDFCQKLLICCLLIASKVVFKFKYGVELKWSKLWSCRIRHWYVIYTVRTNKQPIRY